MASRTRIVTRLTACSAGVIGLSLGLAACGGDSSGSSSTANAPAGPNGKGLFAANCATCHGELGKGDGLAAAGLTVKPRNLTTEPYKYVDIAGHASEADALVAYFKVGRVENGMPPFAHLSEVDLTAMAKFVEGLRPKPGFVEAPAEGGAPAPAEGGGG